MFWPKIGGLWNLHRLTSSVELDFFVLFSSTTALWGSSRLGHYAAANSFLDAVAHYRRSVGLPALSINWGTWDVMRVANESEQQLVAQFGLEQMPSEAALTILGNLLNSSLAQVTVASVNWNQLKAAYEARRKRPFLELVAAKSAPAQSQPVQRKITLQDELQGLAAEQRHEYIVSHIRQQVARVITAPDPTGLDVRQGLFEMGFDSLMSMELKGLLETSVGRPLPSTLTFNYPTILDLANYLDKSVLAPQVPVGTETAAESSPSEGQEDLSELSEEDLAAQLEARLMNLNDLG